MLRIDAERKLLMYKILTAVALGLLIFGSETFAFEQPVLPDENLFEFVASRQFECGSISYRQYNNEKDNSLWVKFYSGDSTKPFLIQRRAPLIGWESWVDREMDGQMDDYHGSEENLRQLYPTICHFLKKRL